MIDDIKVATNARAKGRIKRAQFHLALHSDMLSMVRREAAKDGRTVTGWIEKAITEKLEMAGRQWIQ